MPLKSAAMSTLVMMPATVMAAAMAPLCAMWVPDNASRAHQRDARQERR